MNTVSKILGESKPEFSEQFKDLLALIRVSRDCRNKWFESLDVTNKIRKRERNYYKQLSKYERSDDPSQKPPVKPVEQAPDNFRLNSQLLKVIDTALKDYENKHGKWLGAVAFQTVFGMVSLRDMVNTAKGKARTKMYSTDFWNEFQHVLLLSAIKAIKNGHLTTRSLLYDIIGGTVFSSDVGEDVLKAIAGALGSPDTSLLDTLNHYVDLNLG
jgi:hypothetical protein